MPKSVACGYDFNMDQMNKELILFRHGSLLSTASNDIPNRSASFGSHQHQIPTSSSFTEEGNDFIEYRQFYDAYLQPYFGCFTCERTRFVLDFIEMDNDGKLSWEEWRFWCLWALSSKPDEISNLDDLHSVVFRNAILPLSLHGKKDEINAANKRLSIVSNGVSSSPTTDWNSSFGSTNAHSRIQR